MAVDRALRLWGAYWRSSVVRNCVAAIAIGSLLACAPLPPGDSASVTVPSDRALMVRNIQSSLAAAGYNPGPVDGILGNGTRAAIRRYQADHGLPVTGEATPNFYRTLISDSGGSLAVAPPPASASLADREVVKRRELSRNDPVVHMHPSCQGVFIPEVKKDLFRGAVPVFNAYILNNSDTRYRMTFDFTYRVTGGNYFGSFDETLSTEKTVTLRAGKFIELPLIPGSAHSGQIQGIEAIDVIRCERT